MMAKFVLIIVIIVLIIGANVAFSYYTRICLCLFLFSKRQFSAQKGKHIWMPFTTCEKDPQRSIQFFL